MQDFLSYEAECAGGTVILVDPRGTAQDCSGCGCVPDTRKTLAVRMRRYALCGLVLDRDVNAARNILRRASGSGAGLQSQGVRVGA